MRRAIRHAVLFPGRLAYAFANPEAAAVVARMAPPPDDARKALIDSLVGALIAAGVWPKLDVLHVPAAHSAQAGLLNWKGDAHNLTPIGAPVHIPDRGYFTNGANSALDLNYAPNQGVQLQQNSAMVAMWGRQSLAYTASCLGTKTANAVTLNPRSTGNALASRLNSSTATSAAGMTDGYGFSAIDRSSGTAVQHYKDGAAFGAAGSATSSARSAIGLAAGYANSTYVSAQFCAIAVGASLTTQQHADLYAALAAYMAAVGVAPLATTSATRSLASAVTLPDGGSGAVAGKGWTCTGLAKIPADGTWLVGNDGRAANAGDPFLSSIVHSSADFSTILHQWTTASLGLAAASVQGVAWEPIGSGGIRGNIWFVLVTAPAGVYRLPIADDWSAGTPVLIGTLSSANGLALDTTRDQLIILQSAASGFVSWRSKTDLSLVGPIVPVNGTDYDQLSYAAATDELLVTFGANLSSGTVRRYHCQQDFGGPWEHHVDTLTGADAIEGVVLDGASYRIANDAYFHTGSPALNRALSYAAG